MYIHNMISERILPSNRQLTPQEMDVLNTAIARCRFKEQGFLPFFQLSLPEKQLMVTVINATNTIIEQAKRDNTDAGFLIDCIYSCSDSPFGTLEEYETGKVQELQKPFIDHSVDSRNNLNIRIQELVQLACVKPDRTLYEINDKSPVVAKYGQETAKSISLKSLVASILSYSNTVRIYR